MPPPDYQLPFQHDQERYFPEAGLLSHTQRDVYIIIGASKGGVCRVFQKGADCFGDYGYRVKLGEGKIAATNWQSPDYQISYEKSCLQITGNMNLVKQKTATPLMLMALRIVSAVVGNKIIGMLKRLIILVDKKTSIHFQRTISIQQGQIVLEDTINSPQSVNLECADSFSLRHVASGKFFSLADVGVFSRSQYPTVTKIKIRRVLDWTHGEIKEEILPDTKK